MPLVFSRDVLFLHVPKMGGVSVSRFLLQALPRPVTYVGPNRLHTSAESDVFYVYGKAHQTLPEARDFLRERGIELANFRLILSAIRNPYDFAVSYYEYQRQSAVRYELINEREARPQPPGARPRRELEAVIASLTPGQVARIEPAHDVNPQHLQLQLYQVASGLSRRVEAWVQDGFVYAAPYLPVPNRTRPGRLAEQLDFREYVLHSVDRRSSNFLRRLYNFYHLEGVVPPNLRLVRFERLAAEVREALREIGITAEAKFPWLNRSQRGAYATYYDAETEAVVYAQARWLFEQGFYERLDLVGAPTDPAT